MSVDHASARAGVASGNRSLSKLPAPVVTMMPNSPTASPYTGWPRKMESRSITPISTSMKPRPISRKYVVPLAIVRAGSRRADGSAGTTMVSTTRIAESAMMIASVSVATRLPLSTPAVARAASSIPRGSVKRS